MGYTSLKDNFNLNELKCNLYNYLKRAANILGCVILAFDHFKSKGYLMADETKSDHVAYAIWRPMVSLVSVANLFYHLLDMNENLSLIYYLPIHYPYIILTSTYLTHSWCQVIDYYQLYSSLPHRNIDSIFNAKM